MKFVPACGKHYCTTYSWPGSWSSEVRVLANSHSPTAGHSILVLPKNVVNNERYLVCVFTLHILLMNLNKSCLHVFPENNLSLLTKNSDQRGWPSPQSEAELESQRTHAYQQLALFRWPRVPGVQSLYHPEAAITEAEMTHSTKNLNASGMTCGTPGHKKGSSSPTPGVGPSVSVYTAASEKSKQKTDFIIFLFSIKCSYTHKILTHPMNVRWLFKILKSRGTNTRSFMY